MESRLGRTLRARPRASLAKPKPDRVLRYGSIPTDSTRQPTTMRTRGHAPQEKKKQRPSKKDLEQFFLETDYFKF